ncbi:TPA: hypothetical protein ACSP19_002049 [Aeromonas veronii]
MNKTLLTANELSKRIKFSPAYINHGLKNTVFLEGTHYIRPFGGRKVFYIWEAVEQEMFKKTTVRPLALIPMANGGVCHG